MGCRRRCRPRLSLSFSFLLLIYTALQNTNLHVDASSFSLVSSSWPSPQHASKRQQISLLPPSSHRVSPRRFDLTTRELWHLTFSPRQKRQNESSPLLLLSETTSFPKCRLLRKISKEKQATNRLKQSKSPPRKNLYGTKAVEDRQHKHGESPFFLFFPPRVSFRYEEKPLHYSPRRLSGCRQLLLHFTAGATGVVVTDERLHEKSEELQRRRVEEVEKDRLLLTNSETVPHRILKQFPFAYDTGAPDSYRGRCVSGAEQLSGSDSLSRNEKPSSFIYFDNAATTQKPWSVLQALQRAYIYENANVHRSTYSRAAAATERLEGVRSQLAKFLNAERAEEIIFTSGATDSINLVAGSWGEANISEGDEIILSIAEHHSNLVPWQLLATRKNAFLRYTQLDKHYLLSISSLLSLLSARTKLVALSHTSNVLGSFNPYVQDVIRIIKHFNPSIVVLLDASQALAHHKLDVRQLSCDFLVGSGHKMYGPTGVGFLYGRHSLLQEMPPWKGGGEMIAQVQRNSSTYADPPARFEAGTPPFVQIAGLGAALEFVEQLGLREIVNYESKLHETLRAALEAYVPSLRLLCPPAFPPPPNALSSQLSSTKLSKAVQPLPPIPLVSFVHPNLHAQDMAIFLDVCDQIYVRSGHHCCQLLHLEALRVPATCRASLAVYNTEEEVHRFVKSAQSVVAMLERQKVGLRHASAVTEHMLHLKDELHANTPSDYNKYETTSDNSTTEADLLNLAS